MSIGVDHPILLVRCKPNANLLDDFSNSFHQLDRQMRNMKHNMSDLDRYYSQNLPMNLHSRQAEAWHAENPVVTDKDGNRKLQLHYDVRHFKPQEITIKTKDGQLFVRAIHEESSENGKVYREYHRSFTLPKEIDLESMKSSLNGAGILTIEASLPSLPQAPQERTIAIEHVK